MQLLKVSFCATFSKSRMGTLFTPGNLRLPTGHDNDKPIEIIMEFFRARIRGAHSAVHEPKGPSDRIMILKAETGAGKSTTIPPELYMRFAKTQHGLKKIIACTQPTRLNTTEIPKDVAKIYKDLKMGKNLGYQTSVVSRRPKERGVIYMTIGTMVEQLKVMSDDEFMDRYSFIVIDEVHKRDMNIDIVLSMIKRLLERNSTKSQCPFVIIMSATINTKKFSEYFKSQTIYEVTGKAHPIVENFLPTTIEKYAPTMVELVKKIHTENKADFEQTIRDILIFVPGIMEIDFIIGELKDVKGLLPIPLHRENFQKGNAEFQSIFVDIDTLGAQITRRCIVATSLAETGVTIESVKYVIDSGWARTSEYYPPFGIHALVTKPTTKDSAMQRKGRSGRKGPGEWYPMYTKETYDLMQDVAYPDIYRNDISDALLNIFIKQEFDFETLKSTKSIKMINLDSIDLLDTPPIDSVQSGLEKLYVCGAIEPYNVTQLGKLISAINVPIDVGRMILAGYVYNVSIDDLATIAAGLIIEQRTIVENFKAYGAAVGKNLFVDFKIVNKPKLLSKTYTKTLEYISDQFIEFILLLDEFAKVCEKLGKISKIKEWCEESGISYDGMMSFIEARDDIQKNMYALGFKPNSCIPLVLCSVEDEFINTVRNIKRCEYEGFKMNVSIKLDVPNFKGYMSERHKYALIPQADFTFAKNPKYIMYASATMFYNGKKKSYETKAFTISTLDDWILEEHDSKFTAIQNNDVKFDSGEASIGQLMLYKEINRIQPKSRPSKSFDDMDHVKKEKSVEKTYNKKELIYDKSKKTYVEKSTKPKKGGAPNKILWI